MKSNRLFLAGAGLVATLAAVAIPLSVLSARGAARGKYVVYVGTYTSTFDTPPKSTGSKGIYSYRFDAETGHAEAIGLAATSEQPSFIAADPSMKFLYGVNEMDAYKGQASGGVSAFKIDRAKGGLTALNAVPSGGGSPAHVTVDRSGKFVLVSNFNGGNLAVFPIQSDGKLGNALAVIQHHGAGVNKGRLAGPHVHQIVFSPDNRFALVVDLGLDEISVYPFDEKTGKLGDANNVPLTPGYGPRHIAFSPNGKFVYLVSELASTVTTLSYNAKDGALKPLATVPLAPATNAPEKKWAAEIAVTPNGKFLYASNRADNLIGIFSVAPDSGAIIRQGTVALTGKTPRNFAIDPTGRWLWDANQESNTIVIYRIDPKTGSLTVGQTLEVGQPTCLLFLPAP